MVVSLDPRHNLKAPKFLDGHVPACDVAQILQDLIVGFVASWSVAVFASGVGAWEVLGRSLTTLRGRSSECRFPIFPLQTIACRRFRRRFRTPYRASERPSCERSGAARTIHLRPVVRVGNRKGVIREKCDGFQGLDDGVPRRGPVRLIPRRRQSRRGSRGSRGSRGGRSWGSRRFLASNQETAGKRNAASHYQDRAATPQPELFGGCKCLAARGRRCLCRWRCRCRCRCWRCRCRARAGAGAGAGARVGAGCRRLLVLLVSGRGSAGCVGYPRVRVGLG